MSVSKFFLIYLTIYLCLSTFTHGADPNCSKGISLRGACCPSKCGQCGGKGCYQKSVQFKTRCCADGILKQSNNVPTCTTSDPPCRISNQAPPPPPPNSNNPTSTLNGNWRTAIVDNGQLIKRHEACAVMVNGLVVLLGGRGINRPVSIYNPKSRTWTRKNGPGNGIEIHHFQCVAIDNKIWIVSSWTGKFPFEKNNDKIFIYDVKNDKWTTKKGMNSNRLRGGGATVRKGDWIYVVAGNRGGHGEHATSLTWMDAYNWKTNRWSNANKYPNMPGGGRDHVGGAIVKGELCIAGGRDGGTKLFFQAVKTSTYCYNFKNNKWSKRGNFPVGRAGAMTGTTCDGKMMIAGGEGNKQAYARVDVFDGQKWTQAPSLKQGRHGSGLAVSQCNQCSHIFIPSGSGRQGGSPELLTTEEYIPKGSPGQCTKY